MTYKEYYMQLPSLEAMEEEVKKDISTAILIFNNPDRVVKIEEAAAEVYEMKFKED